MSDVVIGASLKVDAGSVGPTIKEVREQIKQYKQELDNATVGSEQHKAALDKLKAANEQLNPTFKDQGSAISAVREHLTSSIPAFGKATEGAKSFGSMLKALMANPIVLLIAGIVAGLKFLYEAFTSTSAGAKKAQEIIGALSEVVKVVAERILSFGRAILDFFSGHWKDAAREAKEAVSGISEEIEKTYAETAEGIRRLQALKKAQREQSIADAKADAQLAKLRESLYDEDTPIKDRIKNAAQVKEIDKKRSETAIANAKEEMAAKILTWQNEFEWKKKHADELAALEVGIFNAQQAADTSLRQAERTEKQLIKQQDAEDKANEKEAADKAKEARQKATEEERNRRENQRAYTERLTRLQQENELALIKDGTEKKLKELEFAQQKEIALILEDYRQHKITADQKSQLLAESEKAYQNKVNQANAEHQKDVAQKEKEFQKELSTITEQARLDSITDLRVKERAALDKTLKDRTQQVLDNEKYTGEQKQKLIASLEDQNRKQQQALTAKYQKEDLAKEQELAQKEIALKIAMSKRKFDLQRQELDLKQSLIDQQYKAELTAAQGNALKIREIELKHAEDSFQISESRKAISRAERDAKMADADAIGGALNALGDLVGKQTAVGKGLAIASSLINTYTGITKALAQGGIAGIAGGIAVGLAGFAAVKQIISTKVPGNDTPAPSIGAASVAAPIQPQAQVSTTQLDQNTINSIGNAAGNRAFVLSSDIDKDKSRTERINRAARIG